MRAAFTLLEVIVAVLLFELGMLALTGVAAVAARDLATANRTMRAHAIARNRVEAIRLSGCATPGSGSAAERGITERWRVVALPGARAITDTVEFPLPSGRIARVGRVAWSPCW